jgi:hypothetical protein
MPTLTRSQAQQLSKAGVPANLPLTAYPDIDPSFTKALRAIIELANTEPQRRDTENYTADQVVLTNEQLAFFSKLFPTSEATSGR